MEIIINQWLRNTLKKPFHLMGFDIVKIDTEVRPPPPVRQHPLECLFYQKSPPDKACAFNCDINWCITELGFGYGTNSWHPFLATLDEFKMEDKIEFKGSILERYYQSWQPSNAEEALLRNLSEDLELSGYPPIAHIVPWSKSDISKREERVKTYMELENREAGFDIGAEEGYNHFGPVSDNKGQIEIQRLIRIYNTIRKEGYKRAGNGNGDIRGYLLRRKDQFRFLIYGGHHRLAAVAALGYNSIPVRFDYPAVIQSQDVDFWPQVQRGVWNKNSAVKYFNWLFDVDSKTWARDHGLLSNIQRLKQGVLQS